MDVDQICFQSHPADACPRDHADERHPTRARGIGAEIDRDANAALAALYQKVPDAKRFAEKAKGILVFPRIVKAGFLWGAQYGEGALRKGNKTAGYYNTVAGSYGLQAGVQSFGYAMFFMSDSALAYLEKSGGFEVGSGPSVVVLDECAARPPRRRRFRVTSTRSCSAQKA